MKKSTLTAYFLLLCGGLTFAQNAVHTYTFDGSFQELNNAGPTLEAICTGQYMEENLPDYNVTRKVYQFDENCGFYYDDSLSGFLKEGSYTIELYFKLEKLNSWKRVIDFKSRTSDKGCYVYNGELNFYNMVTSSGAPFSPGTYSHYVITRNGSTKEVKMYGDGDIFITFEDKNDDAVYDESKKLRFFQDDLVVRNEASEGAIAILRIYNYALDSNKVKDAFDNLRGDITGIRNAANILKASVFPNPSKDNITIQFSESITDCKYQLSDIHGRTWQSGPLLHNTNTVNIEELASGIYIMHIYNNEGLQFTKKVVKY